MKKKALLIRAISAVIAVSLLMGIIYLWGRWGLFYMGMSLTFCAAVEFQAMMSSRLGRGKLFRFLFVSFATFLLLCSHIQRLDLWLGIWSLGVTGFVSLSIWQFRKKLNNQLLLSTLAFSILGFFYCSLLPTLCLRLLLFPKGLFWFLTLIIVVLSGDTLAYLGGRFWGQRRLHDQISPQKTVEGSFFGVLGSLLSAGILLYTWLPVEISPVFFLAVAFMGSLSAQCGDLFESLIKRVGKVKDSGKIMPGHGGILDRIDGILFASPVFFIAAILYT